MYPGQPGGNPVGKQGVTQLTFWKGLDLNRAKRWCCYQCTQRVTVTPVNTDAERYHRSFYSKRLFSEQQLLLNQIG